MGLQGNAVEKSLNGGSRSGIWGSMEDRGEPGRVRPLMASGGLVLAQIGVDSHTRKFKIPIFEGEDTYGWIYCIERYFAVNRLLAKEKLMSVGLYLEGKALAWYHWSERRQPMQLWAEFKERLLERFQPMHMSSS